MTTKVVDAEKEIPCLKACEDQNHEESNAKGCQRQWKRFLNVSKLEPISCLHCCHSLLLF